MLLDEQTTLDNYTQPMSEKRRKTSRLLQEQPGAFVNEEQ